MTITNTSMQSALLLSDMPANAALGGQMNIQLSTVDGEQISLSESEFFSMLKQNLIQLVSDESGQVIDNKELMAMVGGFETGSDLAPGDSLPVEWMQYLKSHFTQQNDFSELAADADQLLNEDIDADENDVVSVIDNVTVAAIEVDPVAIPFVVATGSGEGEVLPPGRQSSSSRMPAISAVARLDAGLDAGQVAADADSAQEAESVLDVSSEEADFDPKALLTAENNHKETRSKHSAEVVNIRQQVTATETVTTRSVDSSTQLGVTSVISQTANTANQVFPPHLQSLSVAASANNQQWGDALGERVTFLINQKMNNAEIRIDPPHLGKLDIQIHVKDDTAQVVIHTQHAHTRDLVESSSFRLREILQDAGYSSVDVNVSQRDSSNQNASGEGQGRAQREQSISQDSTTTAIGAMRQASISLADGRIDYFA